MNRSPTAPRRPAEDDLLAVGREVGRFRVVNGLDVDLLLDLPGQDVLNDQRPRLSPCARRYASRSPLGDHDIHGTVLKRPPGEVMYSQPLSWSKPLVRLRMIEPSLAETRTMSSSPSFRLPLATAIRSPEGDGSAEIAWLKDGLLADSGARFAAVIGRPLLVAERLEALFEIPFELLIEFVAAVSWNASCVGVVTAADDRLAAARSRNWRDAFLAPPRFDELVTPRDRGCRSDAGC